MIEFGPPNGSIHKIDEHIEVRFIEPLKNIYRRTLENLLLLGDHCSALPPAGPP